MNTVSVGVCEREIMEKLSFKSNTKNRMQMIQKPTEFKKTHTSYTTFVVSMKMYI